jgi:hypothetical protein
MFVGFVHATPPPDELPVDVEEEADPFENNVAVA